MSWSEESRTLVKDKLIDPFRSLRETALSPEDCLSFGSSVPDWDRALLKQTARSKVKRQIREPSIKPIVWVPEIVSDPIVISCSGPLCRYSKRSRISRSPQKRSRHPNNSTSFHGPSNFSNAIVSQSPNMNLYQCMVLNAILFTPGPSRLLTDQQSPLTVHFRDLKSGGSAADAGL